MNTFWEIVLSNAVVAGLMAVAAALIGRLWRNPAAVHVLWLAVLVKLFTPPLATVGWPVEPSPVQPAPAPRSGVPSIPVETTAWDGPVRDAASRTIDSAPHATASPAVAREWRPERILAALWLVGSACLAVGYSLRIGRFIKLMRGFEPASDETRSLVADLSARLGVGRVPEVLTTSHTLPPLVWSMGGRPRLVLPSRLFDGLSAEARVSILLHELAHVRRRDHLVRLLELAATVVFWWHPVVWWSRRRLRDLEEECCDAIVLEAAPRQARTYALALLDTLDFLSRTPRVGVPLPTAVHSTDSLTRRIHMLARSRHARLRLSSASLGAGLIALPLAVAFSAEPQGQNSQPEAKPAVIVGEVKNKAGDPLADALVRAVHPAIDLRYETPAPSSKLHETKTDAEGKYRLEIPGLDAPSTVGLDVLKPGYRRSTGMPMGRGEDDRKVEVMPGTEASSSFALEPSLYFKGVAVDDAGKPVVGATIHAFLNWSPARNQSGPLGWAERATTNDDGTFELFNYPVDPSDLDSDHGRARAEVAFTHPDHVDAYVSDLLKLAEAERRSVRVVMPKGSVLSGTVLDAAGSPVPGVVVQADAFGGYAARPSHKSATTDAKGGFVLKGLAKTKNKIRVLSTALGQKTTVEKAIEGDETGFAIDLKPMDLPASFKTHDVLGMKLTDATPEFSLAYEFPQYTGAMILDPGADSERLGVGRLFKGYVFWEVGEKSIRSVREFVERTIAEAESEGGQKHGVRVVYTFVGADVDGTNTQYLKLTNADVDQLKAALKTFE